MNTERPTLSAVPGLSRDMTIPPPPARPAPRRPAVVAETQSADEPNPRPEKSETDTSNALRHRSARRDRQEVVKTQGAMQAITLSLPADLVTAFKARARDDHTTQPETLMDALSATQDQLAELLTETQAPAVSDGLFLRKQTRANNEPMATLSLRLLSDNVDAIDRLATSANASSRSALCAAALRAYLNRV